MCNPLDNQIIDKLAGNKLTPGIGVHINDNGEYELSINSDMAMRIQEWMERGATDDLIRTRLDILVTDLRNDFEEWEELN